MRRVFLFLFFLVLGTFAFSADFFCLVGRQARAAGPTYISSDINGSTEITWTKENSPYVISSFININAPLAIEAGTVVKFGRNGGLAIRNEFHVNGTSSEKVVFTSFRDDSIGGDADRDGGAVKPEIGSWSYLMIATPKGKEMKIRYAELRFSTLGFYVFSSAENMSIKYCDIRKNGFGIWAYNPNLTIEKNIITENVNVGIKIEAGSRTATAVNNAIFKNKVGAEGISTGFPNPNSLKAENNWWGDASGPLNAQNLDGKGNSVSGLVSFDPWSVADPIASLDPVIIIPGIMGSWEKDGKWQIDPIFHTYDNLCEEFLANGYEDGKNFSVFPYEWRDSNVDNAKKLHARIEQIKTDTGRPKVDIVAHSMGGLLAREYIESNYYAGDVDQLITVGTPHLGAPKDYIKWEAGAFFSDIFEQAGKSFFKHEAKENGYDSIFHYIRGRPMASVQELLPAYDYLYDDNGSDYDLRSGYPANYPRNEFLENLNNADKIKALKNVEFTKIIGKPTGQRTTISGYNVVNADMGELWKHGYPHGFEIIVIGDQGLRKSEGDRTVPLFSAESTQIPSDRTVYFQSNHNDLPTDVQKDILEILTGKKPDKDVNEWKIDDILIGLVFSPIDIQIVSPSGKRLGKNFETGGTYDEINGAYYSGFDTNTEFLTIPNPEDGEYKILTEGTGTGEYTIETTKISEDENTGEAIETTATITGTAEPKVQEENKIKIDGDSVKKVEPLTLSPKKKEEKSNTEITQVAQESFQNQTLASDLNDQQAENPTKIQQVDSLKNSVREYFKKNQIKNRKEAKKITEKLSHIRVYLKRQETGALPKKMKIYKTKANRDMDKLISRVRRNSPKKIDESAKNDLVERLNILKL